MLRHVTVQLVNSDELWKRCYKSIRQFYNNKIIIIDNNSDYNLNNNNIELVNCDIINSKIYNTRLYSPFFELLTLNFSRAIIIHDGVIFLRFVDFTLFDKVKFIWHFDTKKYDNISLIEKQISSLINNTNLFKIFKEKKYTGCMGCCLAITKDFLSVLENTYKLSNLKETIHNQDDAIAFERTLSILCFSLSDILINDISFEGEIKNMVWGYSFNDLKNNIKKFKQIEWDTNKEVIIDIIDKSIVKIFGGRK